MGLGPFPLAKCSHPAERVCLGVSCASLVPLGMKWTCTWRWRWTCTCAGAGACACAAVCLCCSGLCCVAGRVSRRVVSCRVCCVVACLSLCAELTSLCNWLCVCCVVKKKRDVTSVTVQQRKDVGNRTQITPLWIYFHYSFNLFKKIIRIKLRFLRFFFKKKNNSKKNAPRLV